MQSGSPLFLRVSLRLCLVLLTCLGLALFTQAHTTHAQSPQTITVSPCDESALDAAITQANTDNADDTITFNCSGGSSDITLTSTLNITGSMTLDGSGQNVTLDGNNSVQVIKVTNTTVTLNALTIANGYGNFHGGGLDNVGGTVNITNSTFTGNAIEDGGCDCVAGGGLYNEFGGTVNITNSTFTNNVVFDFNAPYDTDIYGGGLYNRSGTVNITNSTFTGNQAVNFETGYAFGGGLYNEEGGTMNITNSTVSGNFSAAVGGGLENLGTATITNSTFANNMVSATTCSACGYGGGLYNLNVVSITNSTFTGNSARDGGGLYSTIGTITIGGSIVANNPGGNCSPDHPGSITSTGYNLESGTDCGFTSTGDLQNTDPKLAPSGLQNNGGPTQTIALQSGSPASDTIPSASCPSTDQRGVSRPDNGESTCDMGAYEFVDPPDHDLALTNVPANITTTATSPQGATVTYTPPTVVDEDSPLPTVSCNPASGSPFPIGPTTVTCTVSDSDDSNSPVSQSFTVTVNPVLTASGKSVSATEGQSFSGVVATGTDYGAGTPSASIDWGDGQTSSGTVSLASDGSYSVTGSHTYSEEGASYALKVTVSGSGVPNATATSSASVSDAALSAKTPTAVIKGNTLTLTTTFTDADPSGTASDYTASITWGDSTTSAATIGSSGASFSATGSHKYAKHGTYTVTVTIKDAGGSSTTKTLTIKV